MNIAIETIAASVTAPGAAGAQMTAVAGDSLRIRDASSAMLLDVPCMRQVAGSTRITSPLLHDNVVGLTVANTNNKQWLNLCGRQRLTPQDTLTLNGIGSAVAGDVEVSALTIMYHDLAGISGNFVSSKQYYDQVEELFFPSITVTPTAAGWSGAIAITSQDDQYKANEDYAWIGLISPGNETNMLGLAMTSPDWGNLRVMCPLRVAVTEYVSDYWGRLSDRFGVACIPVFNASQKSNVTLTALTNENLLAIQVSLVLGRLGRPRKGGKSGRNRLGGE